LQGLLLQCITDRSVDANLLLSNKGPLGGLTQDQQAQVLALRGLLGCGLQLHGLQKRHQVDYGINR
jgi:hypothetical protein